MRYKHHIIPFHEWKRRINLKATYKNKDFNAPDNVVWLTLEQHIQVHQLLYELNKSIFDQMAYLGLMGNIGKEEIQRRLVSYTNTGRSYTPEQRQAQLERGCKLKGIPRPEVRGYRHTDAWKRERSLERMGNKYSAGKRSVEQNLAKSKLMKIQSLTQVTCPHCHKNGKILNMSRYHFNYCKQK